MSRWADLTARGRTLVGMGDTELLAALGFELNAIDSLSSLLKASGTKSRVGVAVVLQAGESPDLEAERYNGMSPITYAMAVADRENLRYVLVCQGAKVRLYPVGLGVGVGRRGRTETFVELHTGIIRDDHAGYIWALLSADALAAGGTLDHLLDESRRFAGDLAVRLRERVYTSVIPKLAEGLVGARKITKPSAADLAETYRMAMTVLFRLLFVAYAEDKDLLPYKWNGLYQSRSLKEKARELLELHREGKPFDDGDSLWEEVDRLSRAVEDGNTEWGVPAYGGELFSRDQDESPTGARLASVRLSNPVFGPALRDLLLIETPEGLGPVDFRSLGVREFGTVYEGLLESELAVAEADLTTDKDGNYRPARGKDAVVVKAGDVYLHNSSGQRKATGTYFTKEFAVDYLLDEALEPALVDHLARLDKLDETAAAERFFDFRVADIAMGSAHFLVAAIDRIERAFSRYLSQRSLAGVRAELAILRAAAETALCELKDQIEIEDTQLLRRQIARRCVYGVDMNPVAVSLARLSIWIHTFVPGLPLSLLDHSLVCGNSLVGVGRVNEIEELVSARSVVQRGRNKGEQLLLGGFDAATLLGDALEPLNKVARIADATLADVRRARAALKEAEKAVASAAALCDIVTACRLTGTEFPFDSWSWDESKDRLTRAAEHAKAVDDLAHLPPFHFPIAFPEVFLRDRSGFDVLLGNPPWEKARVEEHEFWGRHFPRLRGMSKPDRDKTIDELQQSRQDLVAVLEREQDESKLFRDAVRDCPGMNTGHPDLFRAFIWRFTQLISSDSGYLGIVLPGDAFKIAGATELRDALALICREIRVQMLTNKGEWVFDDVDGRKLVAFVNAGTGRTATEAQYLIPPECHARTDWEKRNRHQAETLGLSELRQYSDTLVIPLLSDLKSFEVIRAYMKSPRISKHPTLRVRRVYADFETSKKDKAHWHEDRHQHDWPVYGGEAFDIWNPDTGKHYAYTNADAIGRAAQAKWLRANRASPYSDLPQVWREQPANHPINYPRIAFRDVTNRTNSRTLLVAMIPPRVVTVQTAPWVLWTDSQHPAWHEAYLLGLMSSVPLDWWCRRFVEGHVDQEAFNCLRIPDPASSPICAKRVVALAGRLAAVDDRFAHWAMAVGVACGPLDDATKQDHIHELDAVVAHLYGLTEPQLVHVFETFHEGWDFRVRLAATRKHYAAWANIK